METNYSTYRKRRREAIRLLQNQSLGVSMKGRRRALHLDTVREVSLENPKGQNLNAKLRHNSSLSPDYYPSLHQTTDPFKENVLKPKKRTGHICSLHMKPETRQLFRLPGWGWVSRL